MGFVSSIPVLLALRIVQGILGGISTIGLIIVSSSSSREWAARDIGLYQNAMTLGQLIGPPAGSLAAAALGYQGAFIGASALVVVTLAFCYFYVKEFPSESKETTARKKPSLNKKTLMAWGLCFTVCVQLMFLPSVLPNVFRGFHLEESMAVKAAGLVVMLYTATAMAGTFLLCRLAARVSSNRLIIFAGVLGAALQFLLSAAPGVPIFIAVRMLQTAMVAAIMPLVYSSLASDLNGPVIGFLNSSRFAGNSLGPMIATSVLAFSSLNWLYFSVGGMSLLAMAGFALSLGDARNIADA
jgi:DHA1 family multidrug resistance protein-like MFS transporter